MNYSETRTTRRRVFFGSLIADDSWHILSIAAMENYGVFDTIAYVESNRSQTLTPRKLRFQAGSDNLRILRESGMWGPSTRVFVDQYQHSMDNKGGDPLDRGMSQRASILNRWKQSGMKPDDIGYIGDTDEVVTRDFLRALQICDVPAFRTSASCENPKVIASTLIFEGSPQCIWQNRRWHHPDLVIGRCIDKIGDQDREPHPLWKAGDFRMRAGGFDGMVSGKNGEHTAFHFHNFFHSMSVLRNKYYTYPHPQQHAFTSALGEIAGDIKFMIDCLKDEHERDGKLKPLEGGWKALRAYVAPIAFKEAPSYPAMRHKELQDLMNFDEIDSVLN